MPRYKVQTFDDDKGTTIVVKGRVAGGKTAREIRNGVANEDVPKAIREAMESLREKLASS